MVKFKVVKAADIALAAALVILAAAVVALLLMTRAQKAQPTLVTVTPEPAETSLALDTENEHTDPAVVTRVSSQALPLSNGKRVLIYHTHTHEAYQMTDQEPYTPLENWRTDDRSHNIVRVGDELTAELEKRGFEVVHDDTDFEQDDLSTSYSRSLEALLQRADEDYDLIIDLHRDAYIEGAQLTCSYAGRKSANLMVLIGKGDSFQEKPHFQENYALACALTEKINGLCPGLGREVMVKTGRYNQHFSDHSLLIEVGSNGNTLEEALSSMPILADAIEEVLCGQSTPGVVTVSSDGAK